MGKCPPFLLSSEIPTSASSLRTKWGKVSWQTTRLNPARSWPAGGNGRSSASACTSRASGQRARAPDHPTRHLEGDDARARRKGTKVGDQGSSPGAYFQYRQGLREQRAERSQQPDQDFVPIRWPELVPSRGQGLEAGSAITHSTGCPRRLLSPHMATTTD
jgi:hypothetical protein